MKRSSYRDSDYAFGRAMLTLRTAIGLTQAGLAESLTVSRRTVGTWEAGNKYPKAAHLKQFIALAIRHGAIHEAEEIRALWQLAHQKVLLDERWLASLLPDTMQAIKEYALTLPATSTTPRLDWGEALAPPHFYGREWELNLLHKWVIEESCRVVTLLGLGGIGKSSLAVKLMHNAAEHFEVVIWRSLRDLPTCETLLDNLLSVFDPQALRDPSASLESRLRILMEYLRTKRALLVLDNLESVLEEGENTGRLLPNFEGFGRFLRSAAETAHQSCIVLTSREKPRELVPHEGSHAPVRAVRLSQLDKNACKQLLVERDVVGSAGDYARLIDAYAGNPLALKIVAQTIIDLFGGEVALFLEQGEIIFGNIRELLEVQFKRLSSIEQTVLSWLAILRDPVNLDDLIPIFAVPIPRARLLEAVESLHRRSLIEHGQGQSDFTLQSVVMEYITGKLIADVSDEIIQGKADRLMNWRFELTQVRESVQQNQERLIVAPILANLQQIFPRSPVLENKLLALLDTYRKLPHVEQGYGPANLVTLLRLLRGHLRSLDLSGLILRSVHLQGVEMQDTSLAEAIIQDSRFTEAFDGMTAVAISPTGDFWAASSGRGEVCVWTKSGLILHRMWLAHADMVWALAFSPDGHALASGSWDATVKVWDIASGSLLWMGKHTSHVNVVGFSPDGTMLVSGSDDTTIHIWDRQSGKPIQTLHQPSSVAGCGVIWSPGGSLFATGDLEGCIRLWEIQKIGPAICIQTLVAHTGAVEGLSFSPDGRVLASASWDSTVKLWDVNSGSLRQALTTHSEIVHRVVWSPDGRTVASCSRDQTIWLWDIEQSHYRAVLRGHGAGVRGLAFTPDSHILVSSSEDGTLRVWDATRGQCLRVIQGYTSSLHDIDWSPDGMQLASGGTDYMVTIYSVLGTPPPHVLRGHRGVVNSVEWSPDGRYLASSEWDNAIRIWEIVSGNCLQILQHPTDTGNFFFGLAWSPDGQRLAAGTHRHGVQVFEITAHNHHWVSHPFPAWIRQVAWHPDGTRIAGGGDDGVVYVWDMNNGKLLQQLTGHSGKITCLAWSPEGKWLASGGAGIADGELYVWDMTYGVYIQSFTGHPEMVSATAWGSEENQLISGSADGILRWWDVGSGERTRLQEAHQGTIISLRTSPDKRRLASCGNDGSIRLWNLYTGEYLQTLRRDRPYERLNISGIQGLSDAQKAILYSLGAIDP